jgi:hypothetical protein
MANERGSMAPTCGVIWTGSGGIGAPVCRVKLIDGDGETAGTMALASNRASSSFSFALTRPVLWTATYACDNATSDSFRGRCRARARRRFPGCMGSRVNSRQGMYALAAVCAA